MHIKIKGGRHSKATSSLQDDAPKLAKRSLNRRSTILSGRTIGVKRERLETANERIAARKKDKRKKAIRFLLATGCFAALVGIIFLFYISFLKPNNYDISTDLAAMPSSEPSIEIIDEDAGSTGGKITTRMKEYIARVEDCFKERGYSPQKAVIPSSGIREVRIYLDGYGGFIKMVVDRDPAVSVEDADRMIRYLKERNVEEYRYIDVRIDGKAYWK